MSITVEKTKFKFRYQTSEESHIGLVMNALGKECVIFDNALIPSSAWEFIKQNVVERHKICDMSLTEEEYFKLVKERL